MGSNVPWLHLCSAAMLAARALEEKEGKKVLAKNRLHVKQLSTENRR